MTRPSHQTPDERRAEGLRLEAERYAADLEAAYLFSHQAFVLGASEEELREELPLDEIESILDYRRGGATRPA